MVTSPNAEVGPACPPSRRTGEGEAARAAAASIIPYQFAKSHYKKKL